MMIRNKTGTYIALLKQKWSRTCVYIQVTSNKSEPHENRISTFGSIKKAWKSF